MSDGTAARLAQGLVSGTTPGARVAAPAVRPGFSGRSRGGTFGCAAPAGGSAGSAQPAIRDLVPLVAGQKPGVRARVGIVPSRVKSSERLAAFCRCRVQAGRCPGSWRFRHGPGSLVVAVLCRCRWFRRAPCFVQAGRAQHALLTEFYPYGCNNLLTSATASATVSLRRVNAASGFASRIEVGAPTAAPTVRLSFFRSVAQEQLVLRRYPLAVMRILCNRPPGASHLQWPG